MLIVTRVEEETKRLFEHVQNGGRGGGNLLMLNTDRIEELHKPESLGNGRYGEATSGGRNNLGHSLFRPRTTLQVTADLYEYNIRASQICTSTLSRVR